MAGTRFHLAWFTNALPHGWLNGPSRWAGNDLTDWMDGSFLVDMARSLERTGFDYLMLEDHVAFDAMSGMTARLDPVPLVPLLTSATRNLGVIATMSTAFYPPFMLARTAATLDQISHGRTGWNIVTTSETAAAEAFGMDAMPSHADRYAQAAEYTELVMKLWDGWAPDAITMDAQSGRYVDPGKVTMLDFQGDYYRCKGALNVARSPQGRPIICQAGTSDRGKDFAARYADTILVSTGGADDFQVMKDLRDDVRARAVAAGRDPDGIKTLFMITPLIADSMEEAEMVRARVNPPPTDDKVARTIAQIGAIGMFDLSQFPYDEPLPPIDISAIEGHQATFGNFIRLGQNGRRTLRQMVGAQTFSSLDLVGTPESIADRMEAAMEFAGGDGFLLQCRPLTRRYISEVTEGLVPILQKRGLVRSSYSGTTLRENLMAF